MNPIHLILACVAAGGWSAAPDWRPEVFDYDSPIRLDITEKGEPADKLPDTRQQELVFRNLEGEPVRVVVTLPPKGKGPFPAVLLVHPLGGDRHQMTGEMGKALTSAGFACVALDLPFHGDRADKERKQKPEDLFAGDDAEKAYRNIVRSIKDIRQTIDLIKLRKDLDANKGVPLVGYSLGAWFGTLAGSADRRVSMLILQGAGTGEAVANEPKRGLFDSAQRGPEQMAVLTRYPTVRLETALPKFEPRPLLMQNGKKDPFIPQDSAKNLYRLAGSPKELKWYDCGHILPEQAGREAAEWIAKKRDAATR